MQIPDIRQPSTLLASIRSAVRATVDDAVRLGLVWRLRPGTIGGSGAANPHATPVVVDGDNAQMIGRSWVGPLISGQRVWCLFVPPAGVYIVGILGDRVLQQQQTGRAKVSLIGNQSVSNNTNTIVSFTTSLYDSHNYWNGSTAFTVPTGLGGLYTAVCNGAFASNGTGSRAVNVVHNGVRVASVYDDTHSLSTWRDSNVAHLVLAEGDTVQMQVFQTSGGSLNLTGSTSNITTFSIARIQPS